MTAMAEDGAIQEPGAQDAAAQATAMAARQLRAYRDDGPICTVLGRLARGLLPPLPGAHTGRLDWLVPPIIRSIEYGYLAVLGFAQGVSAPLIYALIAVLAYHHYDTVYRTRQRLWPHDWVFRAGLGWEGRMLIVAFAGLSGLLPFAYAALAAYLGVLFVSESVTTWTRTGRGTGEIVDLEED
ncbi:DUF5941 domain-containing protein [Actinomadura sp. 6N118]|uniref:DUF5941 domain-containing protein n=1 Tax=Actinomadura sp. 6N118 TaxID=3375151 RepID=UPI0037B13A53